MSATPSEPIDPPANGRAGLRHWRHDLLAGLVVSLVSLPLSSGIAIASGAPPIYGIISSVIAGLVFPFVGGSYVTIAGPAAGLAPALFATMAALGGAGDADTVGAGYQRLLVVIFVVGLVQVVMARLRLARYAAVFPVAVVEGMLGAIGLLILVKALPLWLGYQGHAHPHHFLEYVTAIPEFVAGADPVAAGIGVVSLAIMFAASSRAARRLDLFRIVPPHLYAVAFAVIAGLLTGLGERGASFLIEVPANPLSGIAPPAFADVFGHPELWYAVLVGVVTLTLVDGVESLATAQAIDRIDVFRRRSDPDRVLAAMGISNVVSSLVGGLTIIPGGVKSKTNIEAGGRTLWANFGNAMFLLGFLFVAPGLISLFPKAALGAILVYTGYKMVQPAIAHHLADIGREQLVFYGLTIAAILATDLLVGVLIGTALKGVMLAAVSWRALPDDADRPRAFLAALKGLFADPVSRVDVRGDTVHVTIDRPLVCFNGFRLHERIDALPGHVRQVEIELSPAASIVDHTACDGLTSFARACRTREVTVQGLEQIPSDSAHELAFRVREARRLVPAPSLVAVAATGDIPDRR